MSEAQDRVVARGHPVKTDAGKLMDCATIARELGVSRSVAETMMRQLPKVQIPDVRKVYVRRADVDRLINENTVDAVTVTARKRRAA